MLNSINPTDPILSGKSTKGNSNSKKSGKSGKKENKVNKVFNNAKNDESSKASLDSSAKQTSLANMGQSGSIKTVQLGKPDQLDALLLDSPEKGMEIEGIEPPKETFPADSNSPVFNPTHGEILEDLSPLELLQSKPEDQALKVMQVAQVNNLGQKSSIVLPVDSAQEKPAHFLSTPYNKEESTLKATPKAMPLASSIDTPESNLSSPLAPTSLAPTPLVSPFAKMETTPLATPIATLNNLVAIPVAAQSTLLATPKNASLSATQKLDLESAQGSLDAESLQMSSPGSPQKSGAKSAPKSTPKSSKIDQMNVAHSHKSATVSSPLALKTLDADATISVQLQGSKPVITEVNTPANVNDKNPLVLKIEGLKGDIIDKPMATIETTKESDLDIQKTLSPTSSNLKGLEVVQSNEKSKLTQESDEEAAKSVKEEPDAKVLNDAQVAPNIKEEVNAQISQEDSVLSVKPEADKAKETNPQEVQEKKSEQISDGTIKDDKQTQPQAENSKVSYFQSYVVNFLKYLGSGLAGGFIKIWSYFKSFFA